MASLVTLTLVCMHKCTFSLKRNNDNNIPLSFTISLNHLSGSTVNFQYSVLVWSLLSLILSSWVNSALGFIAELGWNSIWFRESLYMHMCMWERERECTTLQHQLHISIELSTVVDLFHLSSWYK